MMTYVRKSMTSAVAGLLLAASAAPALAADNSSDEWKFNADIYLYATPLSVELPNGIKDEKSFSDLLKNLNMTFMGRLGAQRGKWSLSTDLIYLDASDKIEQQLLPALELREIGLKSWIVSPKVGYEIYRNEKFSASLDVGMRYLWVKVPLQFRTSAPLPEDRFTESGSDSHYDAVVGMTGNYQINDKWYAAGGFDVGTGDSDYVWQAAALFGYRFERLDVVAGYRYMYWELDADSLKSLELKGPIAGISWKF